MSAKKMSQREARAWKRRALIAEGLVDAVAVTPSPRLEICSFTLDAVMQARLHGAERFGARCRVERFGDTFRVFAFTLERPQ